jgi:type II secretion system protein I
MGESEMSRICLPCLNPKGLTLIELLIAVAILSIALLAVFGPLIQFALTNGEMEARAGAVQLAQAKLEEVKAKGFSYASEHKGTQTETAIPVNGLTYDRSLVITGDDEHLAEIQVTVSWNYNGQVRTMRFATSIVNMGG